MLVVATWRYWPCIPLCLVAAKKTAGFMVVCGRRDFAPQRHQKSRCENERKVVLSAPSFLVELRAAGLPARGSVAERINNVRASHAM